jgi:hypothetical protein
MKSSLLLKVGTYLKTSWDYIVLVLGSKSGFTGMIFKPPNIRNKLPSGERLAHFECFLHTRPFEIGLNDGG